MLPPLNPETLNLTLSQSLTLERAKRELEESSADPKFVIDLMRLNMVYLNVIRHLISK